MNRRLRVSVLGNSTGVLMVPPPSSPDEQTYPHELERLLRADDLDVVVRNDCRLFDVLPKGYRRFQETVLPWSPDVLVLAYGIIELQPNVVPTAVVRHMTTRHVAGGGPLGVWRRRGIPKAWPPLRDLQRWSAARVGTRTWRVRPGHFAAELARTIANARTSRSLVLVCDVPTPGERMRHFFPGIEARHAIYQDVIARTVDAAADSDVRLVRLSSITDARPEAIPDGMHLDAGGHRTAAELLAAEAAPWLKALL